MSEANTIGVQQRFGPPPVSAITVAARKLEGDRWALSVSVGHEGAEWDPRVRWDEATRADVLEAVVVELYRALG